MSPCHAYSTSMHWTATFLIQSSSILYTMNIYCVPQWWILCWYIYSYAGPQDYTDERGKTHTYATESFCCEHFHKCIMHVSCVGSSTHYSWYVTVSDWQWMHWEYCWKLLSKGWPLLPTEVLPWTWVVSQCGIYSCTCACYYNYLLLYMLFTECVSRDLSSVWLWLYQVSVLNGIYAGVHTYCMHHCCTPAQYYYNEHLNDWGLPTLGTQSTGNGWKD